MFKYIIVKTFKRDSNRFLEERLNFTEIHAIPQYVPKPREISRAKNYRVNLYFYI